MKYRPIKLCVIILVLVLSSTVYASEQWTTYSSKDEMTGAITWYAYSPKVSSVSEMSFPYSGTKAWLGIGFDGMDEWVYVGFSNEPNLTNTSLEDGYSVITTRIKWDEDVEYATLTQDWGSRFIHFGDYKAAISRIETSSTFLLELDWYGEGKVYFRFPLAGSADAIESIRDAYKN